MYSQFCNGFITLYPQRAPIYDCLARKICTLEDSDTRHPLRSGAPFRGYWHGTLASQYAKGIASGPCQFRLRTVRPALYSDLAPSESHASWRGYCMIRMDKSAGPCVSLCFGFPCCRHCMQGFGRFVHLDRSSENLFFYLHDSKGSRQSQLVDCDTISSKTSKLCMWVNPTAESRLIGSRNGR